jgi:calcineurin-like phosphoesterase family protein
MIKIKRKSSDYSQVLVTSDLHYGHNKDFVWAARGFENEQEHSAWIRSQLLNLDPKTLLIFLGDFGLSVGPDPIINLIREIPCETLMVWGNHNSGVKQLYATACDDYHASHEEVYPLPLTPNVTMIGDSMLLKIDHSLFYCTHMSPLVYPEMSLGALCLCGHSHGKIEGINPRGTNFGKILDCGVDNAKAHNSTAFFSLQEIQEIMVTKPRASWDHH